ncbi:hypothetical protein RT717_16565 [Imperialibacter roseus]|uniref:Lipoprotein n=1 Tax=Imperialibacter roseus TaxID=1324217 RepID=A0ABZ0II38_9BACT|nr:hypothetical protein [Imperialibacter roseus]WOK04695.1 hypothetical protein RT717_16565 [Imperialibacter roseus]
MKYWIKNNLSMLILSLIVIACGGKEENNYQLTVKNPFVYDIEILATGPGAPATYGNELVAAGEEKTYTGTSGGELRISAYEKGDLDDGTGTTLGKSATLAAVPGSSYIWVAGNASVSDISESNASKDCLDDPTAKEYKDRINGDPNGCQPCAACAALACAIYLGHAELIDLYTATVKQEEAYYEVKTCPELY